MCVVGAIHAAGKQATPVDGSNSLILTGLYLPGYMGCHVLLITILSSLCCKRPGVCSMYHVGAMLVAQSHSCNQHEFDKMANFTGSYVQK